MNNQELRLNKNLKLKENINSYIIWNNKKNSNLKNLIKILWKK